MFAAAVRALLLLGCLPLLHPPGVCPCRVWATVVPHHDADHHDGPGGDCPHCPGAAGDAERPRPADPAPDPAAVSAPVVAVAVAAVPATTPGVPLRPSAAWPSAPPLYLSHCALVC